MPIYEYTCEGCDEAFEALVRTRSTRVVCPKCGGKRVKKGFSSFSATADACPDSACEGLGAMQGG